MLKFQARRRVIRSRLLMAFAIGCTGMLTCCCLPTLIIQLMFGPQEFHTPAEVEAVAKKIAPMVLPPNFTATEGMAANNPPVVMRVAQFDQNDGRGRFVIAMSDWDFSRFGKEFNEQFNEKWVQAICSRAVARMRTLNVKQSREKVVKIRGWDVTFTIEEGDDEASSTIYKQAAGSAVGPEGTFHLFLQVETEFLSEAEVDAFLDSLADPSTDPAK